MKLIALPAFADNYIWMLHDGARAVVVDPGDEAPVLAALDELRLELSAILVTHHHADHVGGVDALRQRLRGPVYGPAHERIPRPFEPLTGGDVIEVLGRSFAIVDVPGHTSGHIAYRQQGVAERPLLFCGDTLFSAGCGRLFEGTAAQMHDSLTRLFEAPADTQVCCTHEYTLSNLRFAAAVEPDNTFITEHTAHCQRLRAAGQPTLPSSLLTEGRINPFLRCAEPAVVEAALAHGAASRLPVDVLAALREWKNQYR
jgi:hydroxyacylglutathione hydrolase